MSHSDIVICTGGLGPTKDDITKHTLARLFGMKLVRNEAVYEQVRAMTAVRHIDFNELNQGQALVPDGCTVLPNRCGTAPGMWFERDGKVLVSLPGVPFEMKTLIGEQVLPRLYEHFRFDAIVHKTAITYGLAESILAETIADWENALPAYLHLAYLPSAMNIRLRLSAYDVDGQQAAAEIDRQFALLDQAIPYRIIGYGDATLESAVGELLRGRGETVAAAESCTGGNIAHRFTALPGASDYFRGGVVAYSNDVKTALLGVNAETAAEDACRAERSADRWPNRWRPECARRPERLTGSRRPASPARPEERRTNRSAPSGWPSQAPMRRIRSGWFSDR